MKQLAATLGTLLLVAATLRAQASVSFTLFEGTWVHDASADVGRIPGEPPLATFRLAAPRGQIELHHDRRKTPHVFRFDGVQVPDYQGDAVLESFQLLPEGFALTTKLTTTNSLPGRPAQQSTAAVTDIYGGGATLMIERLRWGVRADGTIADIPNSRAIFSYRRKE